MALNATMQWYVRAGGVQTNGGGFDSAVSGAGVNYADQDAPQLSITDLTSTASTTVTSALSTFTANMIGNVLRIASGAGATTGYYTIMTYTSASQITLDRTSGTYTAGVAKVGGAHISLINYANGGNATQPTLTTPLAAGHIVNVRGAGTDDTSTPDYTHTGYYTFPQGSVAVGLIQFKGYNGRPCLSVDGLVAYQIHYTRWTGLKFQLAGANFPTLGVLLGRGKVDNCYVDQVGNDMAGLQVSTVINCRLNNTGGATSGTNIHAALVSDSNESDLGGIWHGNFIKGWRGHGVYISTHMLHSILNNIIVSCKHSGIALNVTDAAQFGSIIGNTIHGNTGSGIRLEDGGDVYHATIRNNIITGNGGYGINCVAGTALINDRIMVQNGYNNYGTGGTANTSGAIGLGTVAATDLALDPQFTDTGADNYAVGANMKAVGFPGLFPT